MMFLGKEIIPNRFYSIKKSFVLFLMAMVWSSIGFGQQSVRDSLQKELLRFRSQEGFTEKDTSYIQTLHELSIEFRFYKPDSMMTLSKKVLDLSQKMKYKEGEILSLLSLGGYHSDRGEHQKAIVSYQMARDEANIIKKTDLHLFAINNLATEYEYEGDFSKAFKKLLKGVELASQVDNKMMLSLFNENIALLYASQKDFDEALRYLNITVEINKEIGDEIEMAYTMTNMASIYADAGNHEYSMYYINKSISVLEKHGTKDWLAHAFSTKGKTYLLQGKYQWALYWYNQSKMFHENGVDDERSKIKLLQGIAEANLGLQKDSLGEYYALEAFKAASNLQVQEGIKDAAEILFKINKDKKDFSTALDFHELFQKLSDSLARNESKKGLLMLKTKLGHEQQKETLIADNHKALAKQKNYMTGILGLVLILTVITFLVKRSERIQKNLNKELTSKKGQLERSEQELLNINETKDKLFSIIGHDLRGPIGAFQGLLQMFKKGEVEQTEFLSFIPKVKADIDHISFTLNNLLSWGQTQMNGTITKPAVVDLQNIISLNIDLLSEIAFNKSIAVINKVEEHTMAWSDPDQIHIVIRNLISNALKFTPRDGSVTVTAFEKNEYWEVSIQDTGVGIDKETQDRIFSENSNITTYGTDNEKGTGLGLTLCKEMVENNKGTIWVNSIPDQGTCFKFTLPKAKEVYEQAS